ncbi:CinA family protein [Chryseobacterium sp. Leaf394]|uniref:CinA family protein n=1 Tax=Chryseobacterium sp. Leaf394 TaxID=1736361 RepID=UPI000ACD02EA|nr:CinA family protein [Chryseobacterium sp. Leaf394]
MTEFSHYNTEQLSAESYKNLMIDLEKLVNEIGILFKVNHETVSVAESVSSGLLQFSFSQAIDASDFYQGGITVYTLKQKVLHLNVDENEAQEFDCVSAHIAETMALNCAKMFQTQWSVAVTGYASRVPESDMNLFAFFSISHNEKILQTEKLDLHPETKTLEAQLYYTEFILKCLKNQIDKKNTTL